jgi:hypothetical protein
MLHFGYDPTKRGKGEGRVKGRCGYYRDHDPKHCRRGVPSVTNLLDLAAGKAEGRHVSPLGRFLNLGFGRACQPGYDDRGTVSNPIPAISMTVSVAVEDTNER